METSPVLAISFKYIITMALLHRGKYGWFFGEMILIWKKQKNLAREGIHINQLVR